MKKLNVFNYICLFSLSCLLLLLFFLINQRKVQKRTLYKIEEQIKTNTCVKCKL